MSRLMAIGTYLPVWGRPMARVAGPDEDAVTIGIAAARSAFEGAGLDAAAGVRSVVFVTRELPLLVGGNGAALLAGLGLPHDLTVIEQVGGAPAAADALVSASEGTLVIAADCPERGPCGAAAALIGGDGPQLTVVRRIVRSLPVHSRAPGEPGVRDYVDPRLERERGVGVAVELLELAEKPVAVAGLVAKQARGLCAGSPAPLPTLGASAALFALAAAERGLVLATEQASATALRLDGPAVVVRDEAPAIEPVALNHTPGPEIAVSLAAYERAFEAKLRWEAARCGSCGALALPARYRCVRCGSEGDWSLVPLPRTGEIYTTVTVHVAVPGLPSPYSLAIVELDGTDVRALVKVTGAPPGSCAIGDRGRVVFRRVAMRAGIPDYAYAFAPNPDPLTSEGAA